MIFYELTLKSDNVQEQDKTFMIPDCYLEEIEKILINNNVVYEKDISLTKNKSFDAGVQEMISHLQSKKEDILKFEWWRGTKVDEVLNKKLSLPVELEREVAIQIYCDLCIAKSIYQDKYDITNRSGYKIKVLNDDKNKFIKLKVPHTDAEQYLTARKNNEKKIYQYNRTIEELKDYMKEQRKGRIPVQKEKAQNKSKKKINNSDKPYIELE